MSARRTGHPVYLEKAVTVGRNWVSEGVQPPGARADKRNVEESTNRCFQPGRSTDVLERMLTLKIVGARVKGWPDAH